MSNRETTENINTTNIATSRSETMIQYAHTSQAEFDLSLAGNPIGPSKAVIQEFIDAQNEISLHLNAYPSKADELRQAIAKTHNIELNQVFLSGAGSVGIISHIIDSPLVMPNHVLLTPESTFPAGTAAASKRGLPVKSVELDKDYHVDFASFGRTAQDMSEQNINFAIFMCNPNNPTGLTEPTQEIINLAKLCPDNLVIVSEANIGFVNKETLRRIGGSMLDIKDRPPNIIVLRSFSKVHGLANLRIGYAIGSPENIQCLNSSSVPFTISDLYARTAIKAMQDTRHAEISRSHMETEAPKIVRKLLAVGFPHVTSPESNLILARIPPFFKNSNELALAMLEKGCAVVSCGSEFGERIAGKHIRLTPSTTENNDKFCEILAIVCQNKKEAYYKGLKSELSHLEQTYFMSKKCVCPSTSPQYKAPTKTATLD